MIKLIPADQRHFSDFGWLRTFWLFSFSDYYDPDNLHFGPLRVFNDDLVAPGAGFPPHQHQEMEIITMVLSGAMTHEDQHGDSMVIEAGEVQRLSAGGGMRHSEFNRGHEPAHCYQLWIHPDHPHCEPSRQKRGYDPADWRGRLLPVASGQDLSDVVTIDADVTIYRADLEGGRELAFDCPGNRCIFIYLITGGLALGGLGMSAGGQARIDGEQSLRLMAASDASMVLIDLPSAKGFGYHPDLLRGGVPR